MSCGKFLLAQTPYFFPSTVLPQPASQTDFINIYTKFGTSNTTNKISDSYTVNTAQKTIELELCYWSLNAQSAPTHEDTFAIGTLAPGIYTANLTVNFSTLSVCSSYTSGSTSFTFEVLSTIIGVLENGFNYNGVMVYPNPVSDILNIDLQGSAPGVDKLIVTNVFGQVMREIIQPTQNTEINLVGFSKGAYFLTIQGNRGRRVFKIIKE